MTAPLPAVLDVTRLSNSRLRYVLTLPGEPFVGPTQRFWEVPVQAETIATLCEGIDGAVSDANEGCDDDTGVSAMRPFCRALYRELLPLHPDPQVAELRRALRELQVPLLISADPSPVQWELLLDDDGSGLIGLTHDVARRLKTRTAVRSPAIETDTVRCLMISDPNQDELGWSLPETAEEAEQLRQWLVGRGVHCDVLRGDGATYEATLGRLIGEPYDVIHYAGHIVVDDVTEDFAWRLHGGRLMTSAGLRKQLSGNPLVFLNGCWSAASGASNLRGVEAMTDSMLEGGARVVIGSIYPVPDIGARMFAELFYDEILQGATLGAAMRTTRAVLGESPEYRASWAGFVLYGDPCMRIAVPGRQTDDGLDAVLCDIGLRGDALDPGATDVLVQACAYGRSAGTLGTPHLFAAMVAGPDPTLRDRLAAHGIASEELRQAFQAAFATAAAASGHTGEHLELSPNARAILEAAATTSVEDGSAVSERALLNGFVACAGGNTAHILNGLGIAVTDLGAPGAGGTASSRARRPASAGGPRRQPTPGPDDRWLDGGGRDALELARTISVNAGHGLVASVHVFQGLLALEPSPLVAALQRLGLGRSAIDSLRADRRLLGVPRGSPAQLPLSATVERIVLLAQAAAAADGRADVDDRDLLTAFVEQGGGEMGAALRDHGLPIAALTSRVFDDRGRLATSSFDDTAQVALQEAVDCTRRKRNPRLTRQHLLYGLLSVDGTLAAACRAQDRDPAKLADHLFVGLRAAGGGSPVDSPPPIRKLSIGVVEVLCRADGHRREDQQEVVSERQISAALLDDIDGAAGAFLVEHDVRLRDLLL
jgi:hypothetical protein